MNYKIIVLMLFVFTFLISCKEEISTKPDNLPDSKNSPQITDISPDSGKYWTALKISGVNFGLRNSSSIVYFNDIPATYITSWLDNEIQLKVPEGAKSGKVTVMVNSIKSNEVDFTVIEPEDFESVTIGSQIWMKRNLDVDTYRNGIKIRHAANRDDWLDALDDKQAAWCYYDYDAANGAVYGKLYNWYAVNDKRGLAPYGWHVSTDKEWDILEKALGDDNIAYNKLKEVGLEHWKAPNWGNNSSGFTALGGGFNDLNGYPGFLKEIAYWWTSTEIGSKHAWYRMMPGSCTTPTSNFLIRLDDYKDKGFSVRCVKD